MLDGNMGQSVKPLNDLEEADLYPEEFLLLFVLSLQGVLVPLNSAACLQEMSVKPCFIKDIDLIIWS